MTTKLPKTIKSTFAIIDVKSGRRGLAAHFAKHVDDKPVPVTLTGFITNQWSGDDGESIEFAVAVKTIKIKRPANV